MGENEVTIIISPHRLGREDRSTAIWLDKGDKLILKAYETLLRCSLTAAKHYMIGVATRCFEEKHLQTIKGLKEKRRIQALIVNNNVTLRTYAGFMER